MNDHTRTLVQNIASLKRVGALRITERSTGRALQVPLELPSARDSTTRDSIHVFEGGVVREDLSYELGFELLSREPVRCATLSVNDHSELWLKSDYRETNFGGSRSWTYTFVMDDGRGDIATRLPFAFTCGFSRIEAKIEFFDGPSVCLCTPDIVSLDEPRKGGPSGERAEEANVRAMLLSLTRTEHNQAAEWMFARGVTTRISGGMSLDDNTDWAYAPISVRLQVASDTLDCIVDGLEDVGDAFPLACDSPVAAGGNPRDVEENRLVRALVASMESQVRTIADSVHAMHEESRHLQETLQALLSQEGVSRKRTQSLPATVIVARHVAREEQLQLLAEDLRWRIVEVLEFLDDDCDGFGKVSQTDFRVPPAVGVFKNDTTYAKLREAMRVWEICEREPPERTDASLHALKPDKLFEYSALHKMLAWLWENGFVENERFERPIDRFWYGLESWYDKYENDGRCANTYHLMRSAATGDGSAISVDLYSQPVLYRNGVQENGIDVRRVSRREDDVSPSVPRRRFTFDEDGEFWTPDYLLVIRRDGNAWTYAMDAKYCSRRVLNEKLDECTEKYVYRCARGGTDGSAGVDGVVLLAGKMDAPSLEVQVGHMGDSTFQRVIAPFNMSTGEEALTSFFAILGIEALQR